ncbi:glycosyltransferase family 4 protein [Bacillus thermotolerans]|uniref:glycosyltransferase family 4 protein n=1 Tax=Bacillus thermotolerans TaxID=1221996 RepID=UPI0005893CEE|nr:glycosyltransferase family 4 protein [Bacillus thermotolerans]KKB45027.1 Glycosyltransferase [Bacillus thermotolerans]
MKVLLITNLYPYSTDLDNDINTKALHDIVKIWKLEMGVEVEVIRPLYLPTDLKTAINNRNFICKTIFIDSVKVHILPIWKIPKTKVYFHNLLINYANKENINADVVVSHGVHTAKGASKLAKIKNIPFILGVHNNDILEVSNGDLKNHYYTMFDQAEFIACRSRSILQEVRNIYPSFYEKCFIAFSGIEENIITSLENNIAKVREWKEGKRPLRFITAASLKKLKNIDVNLAALAGLDNNINWEYTILGDGEEITNLKKLVLELGIGDKVTFAGHQKREEVLTHMKNNDIFIMVSAPETFGLAYIEAMARGCLVIGAYNYGIDGVVKDSFNGFLCHPKDKVGLTKKIESIYKMDDLAINEVITQANYTIKNYTAGNAARSYMNKIEETLKKFEPLKSYSPR